jgi:hypothetical protein
MRRFVQICQQHSSHHNLPPIFPKIWLRVAARREAAPTPIFAAFARQACPNRRLKKPLAMRRAKGMSCTVPVCLAPRAKTGHLSSSGPHTLPRCTLDEHPQPSSLTNLHRLCRSTCSSAAPSPSRSPPPELRADAVLPNTPSQAVEAQAESQYQLLLRPRRKENGKK